MIDIEVSGATLYSGKLFVGERYDLCHIIVDTMSDWTVILDNQGAYNSIESSTGSEVELT
jgi:hypothetical protein